MKIGWVKKTDDAKSRRGMNKGAGFGPKNKPSLLSNGRGEGELAGSKKHNRGTESCSWHREKIMQGPWDVSVFWIQRILSNVKSSARKFPSQPEEEQCKYLSFVQAGGCSWRCCVPAGPGGSGSRPEQPAQRAGKAPSQRQRRALPWARDTEPALPWPGGTELGSLSRHLVTNKQQTKMCRRQQSALEVNRRNLESVKRICVARQRHWN